MTEKQWIFATVGMDVTTVIKRLEESDETNGTDICLIVFAFSVVLYFILLGALKFAINDPKGIGLYVLNGLYILLYIGLFLYCGRSLRQGRERRRRENGDAPA